MFEKRKNDSKVDLDGDKIKGNSLRLRVFFENDYTCYKCGAKGSYFAKERCIPADQSYHLNLYTVDQNNKEVLMTKDKVSDKYTDPLEKHLNYKVLCQKCRIERNKKNKLDNSTHQNNKENDTWTL